MFIIEYNIKYNKFSILKTNKELGRITSEQDSCLNLQNLNNDNLFVQHKSGLIKAYKKTESQWTMHKFINIDFYHYCRYTRNIKHNIL